MVGRLKSVELREIWKHEAYDFTSWLFDNCDVLNDQIGLNLSAIEKEKSVGPFFVDILAEDSNGELAIIENQLTKTDHDHLGKLLTYITNLGGKTAVWITTDPRPEHTTAINYLNEIVPQDTKFYLIKIQAFQIGSSEPAPHFSIVAGPSIERKAGGDMKKEFAKIDPNRYEFFKQLLSLCNEKSTLFSNISPNGYQNWISSSAGKSGITWLLAIMKKNARVDLWLGSPSQEVNMERFKKLSSQKAKIEETFGEPIVWDFKDNRKQHNVRTFSEIGGLEDTEKWTAIQEDLVDRLMRLEKALSPYIKNL